MPLKTIDVHHRLGKCFRSFLGKIVTNAAFDEPVRIFTREFTSVGASVGVWCTIGVSFHGNCWHSDDRRFGKPLFQIVIFWFALSQVESPTVIMNCDADVVWVLKSRCAAVESGIIEVPFG